MTSFPTASLARGAHSSKRGLCLLSGSPCLQPDSESWCFLQSVLLPSHSFISAHREGTKYACISIITPISQISSAPRVNTRKPACDGGKAYFWFILEPHKPQLSKSCLCLSEVSTEEWKYPKCKGRAVRRVLGLSGGRGFKKKERCLDQPGLILKQSYFNSLSRNSGPLFISVLTKEKPSELIIINLSLKTNPYFLW